MPRNRVPKLSNQSTQTFDSTARAKDTYLTTTLQSSLTNIIQQIAARREQIHLLNNVQLLSLRYFPFSFTIIHYPCQRIDDIP